MAGHDKQLTLQIKWLKNAFETDVKLDKFEVDYETAAAF